MLGLRGARKRREKGACKEGENGGVREEGKGRENKVKRTKGIKKGMTGRSGSFGGREGKETRGAKERRGL